MSITAWLVGSVRWTADVGVTIDASSQSVAAGSYYLEDSTNSLSLLERLKGAMDLAGVSGASVTLTRAGRVRIQASSAFSITWTDVRLRDALGFASNVTSQTDVTAGNQSPLLWSPDTPERPSAPKGVQGHRIPDTVVNSSRSGLTTSFTTHNTMVVNEFTFDHVPISRVWTPGEQGGEFQRWLDEVGNEGRPWKLWVDVTEDAASSVEASPVAVLGPYKLRNPMRKWYDRRFPNADLTSRIRVAAVLVSELSNA